MYLRATINSRQQFTNTIMGNTIMYRSAPIKSNSVFIDQSLNDWLFRVKDRYKRWDFPEIEAITTLDK